MSRFTIFITATCISLNLSFAGEITGWRVDGSGRFPDAKPPMKWSADENIVWKTELPGNGYATPIVVGKRIFVTSEPADVICIDAADGSVVWTKSLSINEILGVKKAEDILARYKQLQEKEKATHRKFKDLDNDDPKREELKAEATKYKAQMQQMKLQFPIGRGGGSTNACGTPVCDGERLFVTFGTGIVGAFTLDGERIWSRFIEGSTLNFGHSNSPVLADGKLVVHFNDLVALNPTSGKELWRSEVRPQYATPLVTKTGDETILITPSGTIIRAADGYQLGKADFNTSEATPVLHDGIVYAHAGGKALAFRIPDKAANELAFEELWSASSSRGRRTPSSLYYDGLLYGVTTDGIMDVVDTKTGKVVYRQRLEINKVYSSLTLAAELIYAFGTDGTSLVFKPGRKFKDVARNKLESCGSCPVFIGNRMYLRTRRHLYCIGS